MAMMGANPSINYTCGRNCPVENITWFQAVEFANKLSAQQQLSACYEIQSTVVKWNSNCKGWRLPTEQEWEFIAHGSTTGASVDTNSLNSFAGYPEWEGVAWGYKNSANTTHPVSGKSANGFGLFDMAGNVSEWVWDVYVAKPNTTPQNDSTGQYRVFKGGSYRSQPQYLSSYFRNMRTPLFHHKTLGVRLVRDE